MDDLSKGTEVLIEEVVKVRKEFDVLYGLLPEGG